VLISVICKRWLTTFHEKRRRRITLIRLKNLLIMIFYVPAGCRIGEGCQ